MKNELIKIETREGFGRCVSLRELYEGLGIKSKFTIWSKRMFEYGFEEEKDFIPFLGESNGGRPSQGYIITIDMAKEICMIQRSDIGREFRKYFIECEKQLKEAKSNVPQITEKQQCILAIYEGGESGLVAAKRLSEIEVKEKTKVLVEKIEEDKPKVEYTDRVLQAEGLITTTTIAKDFGMSARKLNGILNKEGIQYKQGGQWFLYSQYQDKGFMQSSTNKEGHINSKWTQTGRKFVVEFLLDLGYVLNKDVN